MSTAKVTGTGVTGMQALAARLRAADPALRRSLRRNLAAQAGPVVRDVQRSILAMPAKSQDGTLRAEVAQTVTATSSVTSTGVRLDIVSLGSRMSGDWGDHAATLPAHLNSPKGWSHPVFAHGPRFRMAASRARRYRFRPAPLVKRGAWTWVHQVGKPGWFEEPIRAAYPQLRQAAQQAIDDVKRLLGG